MSFLECLSGRLGNLPSTTQVTYQLSIDIIVVLFVHHLLSLHYTLYILKTFSSETYLSVFYVERVSASCSPSSDTKQTSKFHLRKFSIYINNILLCSCLLYTSTSSRSDESLLQDFVSFAILPYVRGLMDHINRLLMR